MKVVTALYLTKVILSKNNELKKTHSIITFFVKINTRSQGYEGKWWY